MKTLILCIEPKEKSSQPCQGSSIKSNCNFSFGFSVSNVLARLLWVCIASFSTASAQADTLDLVRQTHQQLLGGEMAAAKATFKKVPRSDRSLPPVIFEQALLDDAEGHHLQARQQYDRLKTGPLASSAEVPSAVNLAAIGRFRDAGEAFKKLSTSQDSYVAGYAELWQLWLTARIHNGSSAIHRAKLAEAACRVHAASPQQQAIAQLYAGNGSVDAVFAAIDSMSFADPLQMRSARTEAAFFAGGYLQYVLKDYAAAKRIYDKELSQPSASIERPLLKQSLAGLSIASH